MTMKRRLLQLTADFIISSFIGWLYEVILTWAATGHYVPRGYLGIPLCPIYGVCSLLMLAVLGRIKSIPVIFISSAALVTLFELICSYIIEAVLHIRLWDYNGWILNLDGRISLLSSLIFGAMGILLFKGIHPFTEHICGKKA